MAAQISSVSTTIISSTYLRARRNVSSPTRRTATASAKRPTWGSVTLRPQALDVGSHPADEAAPAHGREHGMQRALHLAQDLHADRALAGDHVGVVVGVDEGETPAAREPTRQ